MSQLNVFCPINKINIFVDSDRLDDLGQFSKFVLWAINNKYSIEEISETVSLGNLIIQEEIAYLLSIGFIFETETGMQISETGQGYLNLLTAIDTFNSQKKPAHINRFSGTISISDELEVSEIPKDAICLPSKVNKHIIQNRDYKPLQDYAKSNFSSFFSHLRPEFLDSLYFYLSLDAQDESVYQKYVLPEVPSFNEEFSFSDEAIVILRREIQCLYFDYKDVRLEEFSNVLSTLNLLYNFNSSLLSERSLQLLEIAKSEKLVNSSAKPIYFDASTGKELSAPPYLEPIDNNRFPVLTVPSLAFKDNDNSVIINNIEYNRVYNKTETEFLFQKVPFSLFKEVK